MSQKTKYLLGLAAFAVFLALAWYLYGVLSSRTEPEQNILVTEQPGELAEAEDADEEETAQESSVEAPDFTALNGEEQEVRLSDYLGMPLVLNFWASWCPPCKSEMPDFDAVSRELEGQVLFLMVNLTDGSRETLETARSYVEEQGFVFPVLYDTGQEAAYQYGISSIPTTYFIDSEGCIAAGARGALTREQLMQGIDMILTEEGERNGTGITEEEF